MRKTIGILFSGIMTLWISGCVTQQWHMEHNRCAQLGYQKFKPHLVRQEVTRQRVVEVPDGSYSCTKTVTGNQEKTECRAGKKEIYEDYQTMEDVDLNADARMQYINSCTNQSCLKLYGNLQCKPAKSS